MRTFRSSTNTTTRRVTVADRTGWTTCNWYTGGVIMGTTRGSGARRPRLEPDDEQSSRPVLRGLGSGNGARLPDNFTILGIREYRLPKGDLAADPVLESGLGLMRDPSVRVLRRGRELVLMTPEMRAFLAQPKALIITKANVKSRVHR